MNFELGVNDKRLGDEDGSSILRMNRWSEMCSIVWMIWEIFGKFLRN